MADQFLSSQIWTNTWLGKSTKLYLDDFAEMLFWSPRVLALAAIKVEILQTPRSRLLWLVNLLKACGYQTRWNLWWILLPIATPSQTHPAKSGQWMVSTWGDVELLRVQTTPEVKWVHPMRLMCWTALDGSFNLSDQTLSIVDRHVVKSHSGKFMSESKSSDSDQE